MWPYWLIFVLPLAGVSAQNRTSNQRLAWYFLFSVLVLFIGFRYQVGGDWNNYLRHFENVRYLKLSDALALDDPAYYVINWVAADLGLSIEWVNLVCAVIVCIGVHAFCRAQPLPWLALTAAIPYLLVHRTTINDHWEVLCDLRHEKRVTKDFLGLNGRRLVVDLKRAVDLDCL